MRISMARSVSAKESVAKGWPNPCLPNCDFWSLVVKVFSLYAVTMKRHSVRMPEWGCARWRNFDSTALISSCSRTSDRAHPCSQNLRFRRSAPGLLLQIADKQRPANNSHAVPAHESATTAHSTRCRRARQTKGTQAVKGIGHALG